MASFASVRVGMFAEQCSLEVYLLQPQQTILNRLPKGKGLQRSLNRDPGRETFRFIVTEHICGLQDFVNQK